LEGGFLFPFLKYLNYYVRHSVLHILVQLIPKSKTSMINIDFYLAQ
jgi:hypothetical protein